jgi:hypothetical protein
MNLFLELYHKKNRKHGKQPFTESKQKQGFIKKS